MKKKNIIGDTLFDLTTYLSFHVLFCVWSIFWPPFYVDISNLSTDLDFLGQVWGNITICNMKRWEIKILLSSFFSFYMSRWRITSVFHVCLCVWSIFWPPSHQDIANLSTNLEFLGQDWGNKTICKVMGWEMKKNIIGDTFFNSTTYLAFYVGLCVWSTFSPPSHQAISNVSTDLDSLGQDIGFKTICKVIGSEMKKKYYWRHLF